jgi:hypothetical protein
MKKNKKKNKKKTGKMRETKRARVVKNAPSAERRERLSLTLSLRVKLDSARLYAYISTMHYKTKTTSAIIAK